MLNQLRLYYVFVSTPFIAVLIGAAIFFEAIKNTILKNPHPQINYAIFVIILSGGVFILVNARRLVREARTLVAYSKAVQVNSSPALLQDLTKQFTTDITCILQMLATSAGRGITRQEQAAIEHEMSRITSYNVCYTKLLRYGRLG